jgi:hypothetical protein
MNEKMKKTITFYYAKEAHEEAFIAARDFLYDKREVGLTTVESDVRVLSEMLGWDILALTIPRCSCHDTETHRRR